MEGSVPSFFEHPPPVQVFTAHGPENRLLELVGSLRFAAGDTIEDDAIDWGVDEVVVRIPWLNDAMANSLEREIKSLYSDLELEVTKGQGGTKCQEHT